MFQTNRHSNLRFLQKIPRLYLAGLIIFIIWIIFSWLPKQILINETRLLAVPWPSSLAFAGEALPLDNFYVREAWEVDFLIALSQDYQNILYLKRAPKFFPFIEKELKKRGLPDDLKFLAVAESGLIETSTSSAGASGIWQFMPATARQYGLQVGTEVDERRNFEKATLAALDYLEFLHNKFDNWTLALAAYNTGENRIEQKTIEQDVGNYYDLYLNKETSRYLFRIIAIKEIMKNAEKYGYKLKKRDYFSQPDFEVKIAGEIKDLAIWAQQNKTNLRILKALNPWLIGNSLPEGEWEIRAVNKL